jgi:hypothetical protein
MKYELYHWVRRDVALPCGMVCAAWSGNEGAVLLVGSTMILRYLEGAALGAIIGLIMTFYYAWRNG